MDQRGEDLEDRLLDFAARVGKLVDALPDRRLGRHIAGQLEGARESRTWIKLILKSKMLSDDRILPLLDECIQLCNIIGKSVVTAKANLQKPK